MQRHDARSRGKGGQGLDPTAYGGSPCQPGVRPSAAAIAHLGGVGNLRKEVRGSGGAAGVWCARRGGGGGCGLVGGRARGGVGMR